MAGVADLELRGRDVSWSSTIQQAGEKLKGLSVEAASTGNKLTAGFESAKIAVASLAAAYGGSQIVTFLRASVAEAAEAERINVRLAGALHNTGQAHAAAMREIDSYTQAQMRLTGIDDELTKQLVTNAVQMGATAKEAMRLAGLSQDMATQFGSAETAMSMLIRAMNGSEGALARVGISTKTASGEAKSFAVILSELEQKFSGQAASQLETYAGKVQALNTSWGNLKQTIGDGLIPVLKTAADWWDEVLRKATPAEEKMARLARLMEIGRERAYLQGGGGSSVAGINEDRIARLETEERLLLVQIKAESFEKRQFELRQSTLTAENEAARLKGAAAEAEKTARELAAKAAAERLKSEQDIVRVNAELARAGGPMQQIVDYYAAMNREVEELQQRLTGGEMFGPPTNLDYNLSAMKDRVAQRDRSAVDPRGMLLAEYQNLARVAEQVTDPLKQLGDEFEEEARLAGYRKQAQEQLDKTNLDSAAAATKKTSADMAAAQAAYSFAQVLMGVGAAAKQGNLSGVAGGIGSGMMMGGALMTGPAAPYVFAAGAVLSILGGAGAFGTGQRSPTDAQRRHLYTELSDTGMDLRRGGERTNKIYEEEFDRLAAIGKEHLFDAWVDMITGTAADGEKAAGMLSKELGDLNLTFAESADAVAYIAAQHENLTMAQARMETALAGVFSMSELTRGELNDLVNLYQQGSTWQRRYIELQERINKDLEAAAGTADKSPARDQALAALDADRAAYIALLQADIAAKKEWEARLKDEGLNNRDLAKTASGVDRSNYLLAAIEENTRKPTDPVEPSYERGGFVRASSYADSYQPSRGGPVVVHVKLDGKTIATAVAKGGAAAGRRREI